MNPSKPDYLSVKSVRERYGVPATSLYRLINAGRVEAVKIGRTTRISVASLEALFKCAPRVAPYQPENASMNSM
ncbi:helix-turn-helix domain-containing protein [Formicincola oecophyllae]|uniref:Helix-turn-helix domain-containing protein n=1 Tax=Formicincola oecophyllae TaxID=2558361 RepID=A0A4Y6UA11_9PROT|nr:helix-turn-helix domain-containing protein [Formicincola oecophyllae]QDH12995.1 helix-turn-helix domain-containing protein [Formicincola oecophyllae]